MKKVDIPIMELVNGASLISDHITRDKFQPDLIVGIARGGLFLAQMLAYSLDVKDIKTISIQLRDNENDTEFKASIKIYNFLDSIIDDAIIDGRNKVNLLFTDDLIDSGETINLIKKALYKFMEQLKNTELSKFELNIRFAVNYVNKDYDDILKDNFKIYSFANKPSGWLVFPWDSI